MLPHNFPDFHLSVWEESLNTHKRRNVKLEWHKHKAKATTTATKHNTTNSQQHQRIRSQTKRILTNTSNSPAHFVQWLALDELHPPLCKTNKHEKDVYESACTESALELSGFNFQILTSNERHDYPRTKKPKLTVSQLQAEGFQPVLTKVGWE